MTLAILAGALLGCAGRAVWDVDAASERECADDVGRAVGSPVQARGYQKHEQELASGLFDTATTLLDWMASGSDPDQRLQALFSLPRLLLAGSGVPPHSLPPVDLHQAGLAFGRSAVRLRESFAKDINLSNAHVVAVGFVGGDFVHGRYLPVWGWFTFSDGVHMVAGVAVIESLVLIADPPVATVWFSSDLTRFVD